MTSTYRRLEARKGDYSSRSMYAPKPSASSNDRTLQAIYELDLVDAQADRRQQP